MKTTKILYRLVPYLLLSATARGSDSKAESRIIAVQPHIQGEQSSIISKSHPTHNQAVSGILDSPYDLNDARILDNVPMETRIRGVAGSPTGKHPASTHIKVAKRTQSQQHFHSRHSGEAPAEDIWDNILSTSEEAIPTHIKSRDQFRGDDAFKSVPKNKLEVEDRLHELRARLKRHLDASPSARENYHALLREMPSLKPYAELIEAFRGQKYKQDYQEEDRIRQSKHQKDQRLGDEHSDEDILRMIKNRPTLESIKHEPSLESSKSILDDKHGLREHGPVHPVAEVYPSHVPLVFDDLIHGVEKLKLYELHKLLEEVQYQITKQEVLKIVRQFCLHNFRDPEEAYQMFKQLIKPLVNVVPAKQGWTLSEKHKEQLMLAIAEIWTAPEVRRRRGENVFS